MNIIKYLKHWPDNAITSYQLAGDISNDIGRTISSRDVRKEIKEHRSEWIIWNNKWSYLETDKEKIKVFVNKQVRPSMFWFVKWMNNLSTKLWVDTWLTITQW